MPSSVVKPNAERIVVTGGAGLIGLHLVSHLIDQGHQVWCLDNFSNSEASAVDKRVEAILEVDLTDQASTVEAILNVKPQLIFHLACHPYEGLSQFNPVDVTMSTSIASLNVAVAAVRAGGVRRIVNYSSMARYGTGSLPQPPQLADNSSKAHTGAPFQEYYRPNPEDVYAAAKVSAERSLEILCNLHSIEICHVVPHNVYGEANAKALSDPYRGVLLIWTNCLLRGHPFFIYGDGMQKRAPSYVGDCIGPMAQMGFGPFNGEVVNIGALQEYTINDMAQILREVFEEVTGRSAPEPTYSEKRPCEVKDAWCSIEKSVELLGYEDTTSLREGLQRLVKWAAENWPDGLEPRYMDSLEIEGDKVPSVWKNKLMK